MTKLSFKDKLARLGPTRVVVPVPSGSPAVVRLVHEGRGHTIGAMIALRRRGASVLKAKRVVEAAVEKRPASVFLPMLDDIGTLDGELRVLGFSATEIAERDLVDVKALRSRLDMTQEEFARAYELDLDAVRNWEAGRRMPDRAARTYLALIETDPVAVGDLLAARA